MRDVWHDLSFTDHDEFCRDLGCTPLCPPDHVALTAARGEIKLARGMKPKSKRAYTREVRAHIAKETRNGAELADILLDLARRGATDAVRRLATRDLVTLLCGRDVNDARVEVEHTGEVEVTGGIVHAHVPVAARPLAAMSVDELETIERALRLLDAPPAPDGVIDVTVTDVPAE